MNKNLRSLAGRVLLAGLFLFSLNSCEKDKINLPTLSTAPATEITYSTVVTGGNIADDGGAGVTARGVCWGTNLNPEITGSHTVDGAGSGPFTSTLAGLTPGMEYHVRAYATNSSGTSYGSDITFTTIAATAATLTTRAVTAPTHNAATGGGEITDDGGDPVIARGVCWSTTTGPSVTGQHTTDGAGKGSFDSNITGLLPATAYYVRAYATNSKGTAYGNEVSFTTAATTATVTTKAVPAPSYNSAVGGGEITEEGGDPVTARGVCWSTASGPVVSGSHTTDGAGPGSFDSNITGLLPATTYFVRAYATNSKGTAYGNEITFTTADVTKATVTTAAISEPSINAASGGGNVTDDGGDPVTARGVCWSTTPEPLATGSHTTDGEGEGSFSSDITGLLPATTYYVRAYATNGKGTAYGDEVSFTTLLGDNDGNSYGIVTIGDQVWMAKNLSTTKLNDGTPIANLSVPADWESATLPAYVWYSNNELLYKFNYGALYNWYAVASDKLCPEGWHVPTEAEWRTLVNYLGGDDVAGGKLKQAGTTLWFSPNEGATNESGFTALPGGGRRQTGEFEDRGRVAVWWTSTPSGTSGDNGFGVGLVNDKASASIGNSFIGVGRSIRCLKNQ